MKLKKPEGKNPEKERKKRHAEFMSAGEARKSIILKMNLIQFCSEADVGHAAPGYDASV